MESVPSEVLVGLAAVVVAAEEGSATQAASRLGITAATALRRIDGAERALGLRLFDRYPTGLRPTDALRALLPWAEQAIAALRGLVGEVADGLDPAAGVVRIASAPAVSAHVLAPAARAFNAAHPKITLELLGSNELVRMEQLEADIALRGVKPTPSELVAKCVLQFDLVVAAAPELAAGYNPEAMSEVP